MNPAVEIIAHRGANREAPENTLAAFERALAAGADGIELDIQFTRDGVPVVHHDPAVQGHAIQSLTLGETLSLKPVPSLEDVLELVNGRSRLYVEIKAPTATEAVVRQLSPHADWCAIHSFDHRVAALAAAFNPALPVGILLVSYLVDITSAMREASARDVWQQADFIDQALIYDVHTAGGRVVAWTVNDPERARSLAAKGVDAICTDVPRELLGATGRLR